MKIFLIEWACSQPVGEGDVQSPYLSEGKAMLLAVIEDLVKCGHQVVTIAREALFCPMDDVDVHQPTIGSCVKALMKSLAASCAASILIAPECFGILEEMVRTIELLSVRHIGCSSAAVALCADKFNLYKYWARNKVPTPETWTRLADVRCSGSLIIKPKDGAGAERTVIVRSLREAHGVWAGINEDEQKGLIIQAFVPGIPASIASLTRIDGTRIFMPACGQLINVRNGYLSYEGGWTPLSKEMQFRSERLASMALSGIKGIHGWVGVDLVLGDSSTGTDDYVIEINPRLTSSYLGIRQLIEPSPVPWWVDLNEGPLIFRNYTENGLCWSKSGVLETHGGG